MGLLSGLEKFGLGRQQDAVSSISDTIVAKKNRKKAEAKASKAEKPKETDFLTRRNYKCPVCTRSFKSIGVRKTKLRRMEPERDLRPRYQFVDAIKYDTVACPNCGYAAMSNYFEHVTPAQIKNLKEQIMRNYKPIPVKEKDTCSYEEAIERFNLCLLSAMVKNVPMSEKAFICLKTAWLYRAMIEEKRAAGELEQEKEAEYRERFDSFYHEAYDGFLEALMKERPPICGMNSATVQFLVANMAAYFGDTSTADKTISVLLHSKETNANLKDRCLDLREEIRKELRANESESE